MVVTWFLSVMVKWEGGAYIFQTFRSPIRILGDKKQEIYWRLTNIRCNHTKFRHLADQAPRILELLLWGVATVCMLVFPWFGIGSTTASHYWPQSASSALPSGWLCVCVCARACVHVWPAGNTPCDVVPSMQYHDCMHGAIAHVWFHWGTEWFSICPCAQQYWLQLCSILQISHTVSLSLSLHVCHLLSAYLKHVQAIHHHCLQCTCSTIDSTHQLRISAAWLLLHETKSLPSGPVWTDSPPGMPSVTCAVILAVPAAHPLDGTVLFCTSGCQCVYWVKMKLHHTHSHTSAPKRFQLYMLCREVGRIVATSAVSWDMISGHQYFRKPRKTCHTATLLQIPYGLAWDWTQLSWQEAGN